MMIIEVIHIRQVWNPFQIGFRVPFSMEIAGFQEPIF
jgi:hypothetical protein